MCLKEVASRRETDGREETGRRLHTLTLYHSEISEALLNDLDCSDISDSKTCIMVYIVSLSLSPILIVIVFLPNLPYHLRFVVDFSHRSDYLFT